MIRNYIKIAWRNIVKSRLYSAVNIIGLSTGITFTFLIAGYIWSELQVNKELKNSGRQYIIQSKWKDPNQGNELTTFGPLAKSLKDNYPNLVANYYRWDGITSNVSKGDKSFREGLQLCDSTMLNMYGFRLLHGNASAAFNDPFSVVITAGRAIKYFGKTDVTGQTLTIENFSGSKHDFLITAVLKDIPKNSVTNVNGDNDNQLYVPSSNLAFFGRNMEWGNAFIVEYIELQNGVKASDLQKPMQDMIKENVAPQFASGVTPYLVSLDDYYLSANNGLIKKMLYALTAVSLFILLMAVINFVNMSVSRSATRMREIGVRKVLGGLKKQLMLQFLVESVILVFFATLFALLLYILTRNMFGNILGKDIPSLMDFPSYFIGFPVLLALVIGIIAGIYPAFVLSSLKSIESLKGKLNSVKENVLLRKSLVAFQFGTATIAFIAAIIISKQIDLFFSGNLGFNKDYVLSAQVPRNWTPEGVRKMEYLRNRFSEIPQVKNVTLSYEVPDGNNGSSVAIFKAGADSTTAITSQFLMTDENYASAYAIPMAAGKFFCEPGAFTDSSKVVINEAAVKALGWKDAQEAIGKQVYFQGSPMPAVIAGVTKDFHFGTMQKAIQPVMFGHVGVTNTYRYFSFKLIPGNVGESIAALQSKWAALMPGTPFEYKFMDDTLKKLYATEIQLKKASYLATVLALIIVLIGVLGLVSLSVQKRAKEIGIRKVLGVSVSGVVSLFLKEFLGIIIIAAMVACPLAYFMMQKWLSDYAYRIELTSFPFIMSIVLLVLVTALLITAQTIKMAVTSPSKNLRTE